MHLPGLAQGAADEASSPAPVKPSSKAEGLLIEVQSGGKSQTDVRHFFSPSSEFNNSASPLACQEPAPGGVEPLQVWGRLSLTRLLPQFLWLTAANKCLSPELNQLHRQGLSLPQLLFHKPAFQLAPTSLAPPT